MPFKSEAQRRYLFATHPEVAREFADATPKGRRLPEHVKRAFVRGAAAAFARFGFKQAGAELRLKIPHRQFHGWDAAFKPGERDRDTAKRADDATADTLADLLAELPTPTPPHHQVSSKNPLDRTTAWGPPTSQAAGDTGSRQSDMGQPTSFGGV